MTNAVIGNVIFFNFFVEIISLDIGELEKLQNYVVYLIIIAFFLIQQILEFRFRYKILGKNFCNFVTKRGVWNTYWLDYRAYIRTILFPHIILEIIKVVLKGHFNLLLKDIIYSTSTNMFILPRGINMGVIRQVEATNNIPQSKRFISGEILITFWHDCDFNFSSRFMIPR